MISEDEQIVVTLRDGEKHGELIEIGKDGKVNPSHYYPSKYPIRFSCENLEIRQGFAFRDETGSEPPKLVTYVTGTAKLTSDYDISIIGEPTNKTSTVEISFRPDDSEDLLIDKDEDRSEALILFPPNGRAYMGFNRADWETRSSDQWWLECRLHSASMQPLIDAISNKKLSKVSLSVNLKNLYTHEPWFAPFHTRDHLFLRPNKRDNTIKFPEMANGWLDDLSLNLDAIDLMSSSPVVSDHENQEDFTPIQQLSDSTIALTQIADRIEATRRTVRLTGSLIIFALLLLLVRGCSAA